MVPKDPPGCKALLERLARRDRLVRPAPPGRKVRQVRPALRDRRDPKARQAQPDQMD